MTVTWKSKLYFGDNLDMMQEHIVDNINGEDVKEAV